MELDCTIDITTEQRRTILTLLNRHLPSVPAWVYGSRAKWTSRPDSDLDLVVFATPEQRRRVSSLREAFDESGLPFRVDLFVWDNVPDEFRDKIEADHVELVPKPRATESTDWHETHWGEIATLEYGRALRGYDTAQGKYRVFGTNGPIGWHDDALCKHASVIVGRKGAYRGIHFSPGPFYVIDTAFYLKPKVELVSRWAYYTLLTQDINGMDSGSAIPSTSRDEFYSLPVSVPPLPEQRAIVQVLGSLDNKIELNRRMNQTLEAMARALFKSWFVDFDPVRAKMAGLDNGLPRHIADLFPDRFVDSELGKIPQGWTVSRIGDEVDAVGGGTPNTKEPRYWADGTHNWATPKDLSNLSSPVLLETSRKITDAGVKKISSDILPIGTVLLSSRAPIGYLAIAEIPIAVNQGFIAMVCRKKLPNKFVLYWCYNNLEYIKGISGGSTFSEISKKTFRPIPVIVPPKDVLTSYEGIAGPLHDRIVANSKESVSLAQIRDFLLPKLISGNIRLNCVERSLEAAS